jgi:hypothetical protein
MLHRACCALPPSICSQLPRLTLCSVRRCLFVCLFVCFFVWLLVCLFGCLFVCLRRAFAKHTVDGAAYAARASSRGRWPFRGLLQECAVRALVRCRQPRRAAAAQAHCTSAYA